MAIYKEIYILIKLKRLAFQLSSLLYTSILFPVGLIYEL